MKKKEPSKATNKKTPTHDLFYAISGIKWHEDLPKFWYLLGSKQSVYLGDGTRVCPDGSFIPA